MTEIDAAQLPATPDRLPSLIDRARTRLAEARTSAEVLEAKHVAEAALHYAKVTGAANEAHADCLRIITRAEIRMAREIDAGQERGEIATRRDNQHRDELVQTSDMLGLDRRRVAEWRDLAEAGEEAVEEAISEAVEEARSLGRTVTKNAVRRKLGRGRDTFRPDPAVQMAGDIIDFLCRIPVDKYAPVDAAEISDPKMAEAIDRYFDRAIEWVDRWAEAWRHARNEKRRGVGRAA